MPSLRTPQNSASSCHQRLFTDLQAVYQKIIQTNGVSFPFRAKDRRTLHTAPAKHRQPLSVANSLFTPRTPSACSSVEEITIKPLQFHERLAYTSCSSRSPPNSASPSEHSSYRFETRSEYSNRYEPHLVRVRSRSSLAAPTEYSEQSIRYVTEQVSLEQARQLKVRSNVRQHRVDRRYFVSGSKLLIQKQAFEEEHGTSAQTNYQKRAKLGRVRHCCRSLVPTRKDCDTDSEVERVQNGVSGVSLKVLNATTGEGSHRVAIPTASASTKISQTETDKIQTEATDLCSESACQVSDSLVLTSS